LPATKAPETTVVATSTPLPTANQRTLRQCLSTEADSVAAVCRAFSAYFHANTQVARETTSEKKVWA